MTDNLPARRAPLPTLDDVDDDAKKQVLKGVAFDALKDEMRRRILAESEDFDALVAEWLRTRKSPQTARRYRNAVRRWLAWCAERGVTPILAEPKDADLWAAEMPNTMAPASINSAISGVSSLYSTLVKWRKIPATPFLKIARRAEEPKKHEIPTAAEVKRILEAME